MLAVLRWETRLSSMLGLSGGFHVLGLRVRGADEAGAAKGGGGEGERF